MFSSLISLLIATYPLYMLGGIIASMLVVYFCKYRGLNPALAAILVMTWPIVLAVGGLMGMWFALYTVCYAVQAVTIFFLMRAERLLGRREDKIQITFEPPKLNDAVKLMDEEKYEEALPLLEEVVQDEPENKDAQFYLNLANSAIIARSPKINVRVPKVQVLN